MRAHFSLGVLLAIIMASVNSFSFAPSYAVAAQSQRTGARGTVLMARNPCKSLKMRKRRVKAHESGRLRLNVYRSNNHIYGQVINDVEHHTVASASTVSLKLDKTNDKNAAFEVGKALGELAKERGVEKLFFDRESASHKYMYHGRIESFVNGVRESGMGV